MNGKTHIVIAEAVLTGLTVSAATISFRGITVHPGIGILSASFGAVLADIDMSRSSYGLKFPIFSKIFTHRGFTHTGVVGVALTTLLFATSGAKQSICTSIAQSLLFGFVVAYISHIIADSFNGKGVPLFWPICTKKIHIMKITTGGVSEPIFMVVFIAMVLIHLMTLF